MDIVIGIKTRAVRVKQLLRVWRFLEEEIEEPKPKEGTKPAPVREDDHCNCNRLHGQGKSWRSSGQFAKCIFGAEFPSRELRLAYYILQREGLLRQQLFGSSGSCPG